MNKTNALRDQEIRKLFLEENKKIKTLAEQFSLSVVRVSQIVAGLGKYRGRETLQSLESKGLKPERVTQKQIIKFERTENTTRLLQNRTKLRNDFWILYSDMNMSLPRAANKLNITKEVARELVNEVEIMWAERNKEQSGQGKKEAHLTLVG
jgi:plasmid maintenance system antidote protein VapI